MNLTIYMSVIPGIVYGMALVELIRIYRHKSSYWETNLLGVFLFIAIITNRYQLFPVVDEMFGNMVIFTLYMLSPMVFLQACYMLTPDGDEEDAKVHFDRRRKAFFLCLTLFVAGNVLIETFFEPQGMLVLRIIGIGLFAGNILLNSIKLRVVTYLFTLLGLITAYKDSFIAIIDKI